MNKMSRKTEYGLMSLKFLADKKAQATSLSDGSMSAFVSAKAVAEATHAPFEVIARVLQILSHRGLLKAEYGVNGGYLLAKNLNEISLFDVVEILESSADLAKCLNSEGQCELEKNCSIATPVHNLNKKLHQFYKSLSLDEVLNV
jgi:Rrf2 family protein